MKSRKHKLVLTIVVVLGLLALALLPALHRARDKQGRIACVEALQRLAVELRTHGPPMQRWVCPAKTNISYEIRASVREANPVCPIARCPFHQNVLLSDGSVQQMSDEQTRALFLKQ
jgi:hypothetical protein